MFDVRLFTGLSLPPDTSATFGALLEELEPLARIRWNTVPDLHITTKFIGKWPVSRLSELGRYLDSEPRLPRFELTFTGLRYRPMRHGGWLLYAQVEPSDGLNQLVVETNAALARFGIPSSDEEYFPHITIGRVPGANPWPELDAKVEEYLERPFGTMEVTEHHLYESAPSGYRQFISIPLQ